MPPDKMTNRFDKGLTVDEVFKKYQEEEMANRRTEHIM